MSDIGKQRLIVHESANGWRGVGSTLPQYVSLVSDNLDYGVNYRTNENLIKDTRMTGTQAIILDDQKPEGEIKTIATPNSIDHIFRSHYQKVVATPSVKFGDKYQYTPEKGRLSWDGGVTYGSGVYSASAGDVYGIGIERIYDHDQVIAFNNGVCDELSMNVSAGGVLNVGAKYKFKTAGTLGTAVPWNGLYQDEYPAYSSFVGTFLIADVAVPIERLSIVSKNNMIEKMIIGQNTRDSFTMGDFTVEGDFSLDFPDDGLEYLTSALQKSAGKIVGTFHNSEYNYLTIDIPNIVYKTNDIKLNSVKNASIAFEAFSNNGTSPITVTLQKPSFMNLEAQTIGTTDGVAIYCAIANDSNNYPAIVYKYDSDTVRYAKWDGSAWNVDDIADGATIGLFNSINIGSDNIPQIVYSQSNFVTHNQLVGGSWTGTTLGTMSQTVDSALDSNNNAGIVYKAQGANDITYIKYDGSDWNEVVHPTKNGGEGISFDSNDVPHILSYSGGVIYESTYESSTWTDNSVISVLGAEKLSIEVDNNDLAGITYRDNNVIPYELKYVHDNGVVWSETVIATFNVVSTTNTATKLRYDSNNNPFIIFSDEDDNTVKLARYDGSDWTTYILNQYDNGQNYPSISIGDDATIHACYGDENNAVLEYVKVTFGKNTPETTRHEFDAGTVARTIAEYDEYDAGTVSRTLSEYSAHDRDLK